jgi:hypothetical protein
MHPIDWAFYHKAHKEYTKVHKGINGSEGTSTTAFMLAPDWGLFAVDATNRLGFLPQSTQRRHKGSQRNKWN